MAAWFESAVKERGVHQTEVGSLTVSTEFLGLDHRPIGSGPPLMYETMIFGADREHTLAEFQQRYATLGEAKTGHWDVVEPVRAGQPE